MPMGIRYPAAIGVAYLAFLFLLWLWLRTSASDYTDFTDFPDLSNIPAPHGGLSDCAVDTSIVIDDGGAIPEAAGAVAQADEFAVPLLVLLVAGTALFSSMWIVYSAPTLFAELLVDGVLSASLYRKLRGLETRHWLTTAVGKTIWPFVITAVIAGFGGMALHKLYPEARSLGEVIRAYEQG